MCQHLSLYALFYYKEFTEDLILREMDIDSYISTAYTFYFQSFLRKTDIIWMNAIHKIFRFSSFTNIISRSYRFRTQGLCKSKNKDWRHSLRYVRKNQRNILLIRKIMNFYVFIILLGKLRDWYVSIFCIALIR